MIHFSVRCGFSKVLSIKFSALYLNSVRKPHPVHPTHKTNVGNFVNFGTLILDFFSKYDPKNNSNKVTLNEKLSSNEKKDFKDLIHNDGNLTLANIMSNISYIKTNKDQKGLGVFMDILFRSCGK